MNYKCRNVLIAVIFLCMSVSISPAQTTFNHNRSPIPLEQLANPIITNDQEMVGWMKECSKIETKIKKTIFSGNVDQELYYELLHARKFASRYILWAYEDERMFRTAEDNLVIKTEGLSSDERRFVFDMAAVCYQSLCQEWQKYDLDVPTGYFYLMVLSSQENFEKFANIEVTDQDDQDEKKIGGVTFPCRFIVMPLAKGRKAFKTTLTHELTHAFVNATAGFENMNNIPIWWNEGAATFFSHDSGEHLNEYKIVFNELGEKVIASNVSYTDKDYMAWKAIFEYILDTHGQEKFTLFLRGSLQTSVSEALTQLQINDEKELFSQARLWREQERKNHLRWFIILIFSLIIGIFIAINHVVLIIIWTSLVIWFILFFYENPIAF